MCCRGNFDICLIYVVFMVILQGLICFVMVIFNFDICLIYVVLVVILQGLICVVMVILIYV